MRGRLLSKAFSVNISNFSHFCVAPHFNVILFLVRFDTFVILWYKLPSKMKWCIEFILCILRSSTLNTSLYHVNWFLRWCLPLTIEVLHSKALYNFGHMKSLFISKFKPLELPPSLEWDKSEMPKY